MAWPCISRVCCLARFWNQFDKSDLSAPLTIQNYSDIAEQEVRSVTKQVSPSEPGGASGYPQAHTGGPRTRGSFKAWKEPSYKPREDYHPPGEPFPSVTQYKQDFKPWPIPRKDNFPWINNSGSRVDSGSDSPHNTSHAPAGEERGRGHRLAEQRMMEEGNTSSCRQEYKPWAGVTPAKSARTPPAAQYCSPGTEANHIPIKTSYQAAYSGEIHRSMGLHQAGNIISSASTNIQPVSGPKPIPTALQSGTTNNPSILLQSFHPERMELGASTKREEHLVRTKFPPNPSAVFQSGSRVFNI